MSGNKAPASLTAMETQLKRNEKEVANLEKQYNDVINKISANQNDLEFARGAGDTKQVSFFNQNQVKLDNQSMALATELENAREKSENLKISLKELKANPESALEIQNLKAKIDLTNNSIEEATKEANELAKKIEQTGKVRLNRLGADASTIGKGFEQVNSKIDKFRTKVTHLISTAMIFSVLRNGLTSLSRGFISLLKSNNTFANSLNQIKANLLTAFTPIYNSILPALNSLMATLSKITGTMAIFINSLFGKTANQAKQNAKALYSQAKATKAVNDEQEHIAGFDKLEVNNNDDSSTGSGGSSGPDINFDNEITYSQKLLDLLNGIKDFVSNNKEDILGFLAGIIGGIVALKAGLGGIKALGIGMMILGIIELISSIIDYMNDPTWENFGKVISSIGIIIMGLGLTIGNIPLIIAGVIATILGIVISHWEDIKGVFQNAIQWIYDHLDEIKDKFGIVGVFIASIFANYLDWIINTFDDVFGGLKKILDGIIDLVAGVFTGDWKRAWNGIKEIFSGVFQTLLGIAKAPLNGIIALLNGIVDGLNYLLSGLNKVKFDVPDWVPLIGGKKFGFNIPKIGKIPYLATGAVIPPNKKFTAVLGAPEDLIRKIVREESGGSKEINLKNATFIIRADTGEEFGRAAVNSIRLVEDMDGKPYLL